MKDKRRSEQEASRRGSGLRQLKKVEVGAWTSNISIAMTTKRFCSFPIGMTQSNWNFASCHHGKLLLNRARMHTVFNFSHSVNSLLEGPV